MFKVASLYTDIAAEIASDSAYMNSKFPTNDPVIIRYEKSFIALGNTEVSIAAKRSKSQEPWYWKLHRIAKICTSMKCRKVAFTDERAEIPFALMALVIASLIRSFRSVRRIEYVPSENPNMLGSIACA